jgi:hypothetical protein
MCARAQEMMALWPSSYPATHRIKVNWLIVTFSINTYNFRSSPLLASSSRLLLRSNPYQPPSHKQIIENRSNHEIPHLRRHLNKETQPSYLTVLCATHALIILSLLVSGGAPGIMFLPLFSPDHVFHLERWMTMLLIISEGVILFGDKLLQLGIFIYYMINTIDLALALVYLSQKDGQNHSILSVSYYRPRSWTWTYLAA